MKTRILLFAWRLLSPPVLVETGQVWRRRSDGLTLALTSVEWHGKHALEVTWTGVDDSSRQGMTSTSDLGWRTGYELVTPSGAQTNA